VVRFVKERVTKGAGTAGDVWSPPSDGILAAAYSLAGGVKASNFYDEIPDVDSQIQARNGGVLEKV
jgi:hypothetical protein